MRKINLLLIAIMLIVLQACKKDNRTDDPIVDDIVSSGMVVACEGAFNQNNSSLHWVGDDGSTQNNIYQAANGVSPGDVLQSYRVFGNRAFLVLNNSQNVEVVQASNHSSIGTITGCDYPRDVLVIPGQKGYISNGSLDGELLTFNTSTLTVTGSIEVGQGPEQLAYNGTHIFVANSGGWGLDNTVSVIDPLSDNVVSTISVGDRPTAISIDYQNNVWVLCSGAIEYDENWNVIAETDARLVRIDGNQLLVTADLTVGINGDHPSQMSSNAAKDKLYIVNNGLVIFDVQVGTISESPIQSGNFRAVAVHPETSEIYLSSAPDYISNDQVFVYGQTGDLRRTVEVGIAPISITFRED